MHGLAGPAQGAACPPWRPGRVGRRLQQRLAVFLVGACSLWPRRNRGGPRHRGGRCRRGRHRDVRSLPHRRHAALEGVLRLRQRLLQGPRGHPRSPRRPGRGRQRRGRSTAREAIRWWERHSSRRHCHRACRRCRNDAPRAPLGWAEAATCGTTRKVPPLWRRVGRDLVLARGLRRCALGRGRKRKGKRRRGRGRRRRKKTNG
mmetsp:Transcript_83008/g.231696  ORF Transcript_83008/g.231696 Transcript_83008/m.231696 type:complete len:203 (+) Transcript_83008:2940-3548(+)